MYVHTHTSLLSSLWKEQRFEKSKYIHRQNPGQIKKELCYVHGEKEKRGAELEREVCHKDLI